MSDDNEDQIGLGGEAADNYPADPGQLYDPSMEPPQGQYAAFGIVWQRAMLAADLLRQWGGPDANDWSGIATKALAAAAIIYPDPKESA